MIEPRRFVANKAIDFDGWIAAREKGVTATQVADASTKSGFERAILEMREGVSMADNPYMEFGRRMEGPLSLWVKDRFEVMPNEWLISHEDFPEHLATPDGLSLNHRVISEIKTTGKPWSADRVPVRYLRQIQWQLHVTGADYCLLVWMLREERQGRLVPGWMEPETTVVKPDSKMQNRLSVVAARLMEERGKLNG